MTALIGRTLLRQYRVDAFVASGGMGAVYRVWDLKRNVPLAMKVLHADLAEDPAVFKRFQREARALQKLAHPNIVPFYGLYQTKGNAILLERFIDGPSLKDILRPRKGRPLAVQEALIYLKALASALGYAHAHGVVHCDVKPGNVMVDQGGSLYLTDFGVARHADSATTTLGFSGTAAYMAPEQCRGEPVTAATDIYALGVMLYEMTTSQRPFSGDEEGTDSGGATAAERIRYAHLHQAPADPRGVNPKLPEALARVILKALAKDPVERHQTMRDLIAAACAAVEFNEEQVPARVEVPKSSRASLKPSLASGATIGSRDGPLPSALVQVRAWAETELLPRLGGDARLVYLVGAVILLLVLTVALLFLISGPTAAEMLNTQVAQAVMVARQGTEAAVTISLRVTATARPTRRPSATPRPTQIVVTDTPVPGSWWWPDENCPASRLRDRDWTRVSLYPPKPNRIRRGPGLGYDQIGSAQPGQVLLVLGGPVCNDSDEMNWWYVRLDGEDLEGWTAEGTFEEFWLDPGSHTPP